MTNNTFNSFNPANPFDKEAFDKYVAEQQKIMEQQRELFNKQMSETKKIMEQQRKLFNKQMAEHQAKYNAYKPFYDEAVKEQTAKQQEEMRKAQEEYAKNHPKEVEANRIRWARVIGFMPADFHDLGDDGRFTRRDTGGETFLLHILLSEEQYGLLMQNSLWMRTRCMHASPLNTYYTQPVKNDHTAQQYRKLTEFNISGYKEDLDELLRKIYMVTK